MNRERLMFDYEVVPTVTGNSVSFSVKKARTASNTLLEALIWYWRWCAEGRLEYKVKQYYYDNYHNHIEHLGGKTYGFSIQTYDSPEGDTWWRGRFTLNGQYELRILEQEELNE